MEFISSAVRRYGPTSDTMITSAPNSRATSIGRLFRRLPLTRCLPSICTGGNVPGAVSVASMARSSDPESRITSSPVSKSIATVRYARGKSSKSCMPLVCATAVWNRRASLPFGISAAGSCACPFLIPTRYLIRKSSSSRLRRNDRSSRRVSGSKISSQSVDKKNSLISAVVIPEAYRPPITPPIPVPTIRSICTCWRSSSSSTPRCAMA